MFRMLVAKGPEGLPAGEIGARLKLPSPTLSFHLNQLKFAGLVGSRRESRSIIYGANFAAMRGLMNYLTEQVLRWTPRNCARRSFSRRHRLRSIRAAQAAVGRGLRERRNPTDEALLPRERWVGEQG